MLNYLDYSFEDIDVLTEKDFLVLAGGDGTINHFLSEEKEIKLKLKYCYIKLEVVMILQESIRAF